MSEKNINDNRIRLSDLRPYNPFGLIKLRYIKRNKNGNRNINRIKNINKNKLSLLDLDEDCQLEIIKYIIFNCEMADKSQDHKLKKKRMLKDHYEVHNRKYADLVNFALAHEKFERIIEDHHYDLYIMLKLVLVANKGKLEIDFSELQATHRGNGGDAFWRAFSKAITKNNELETVTLKYAPESFQLNFLDHFAIIKRSLENKIDLTHLTIKINGYSLDDLNNFGHITYLDLDVRMSAEALVEVCKSNPHLEVICFRSTEILGRLSDIAPHCPNLTCLMFAPKPDIDGVEYAPLAGLPNLKLMTIIGASENGSFLKIFEAIIKWKRPGIQQFKITFSDEWRDLRQVNIARINYIQYFKMESDPKGIILKASYNFSDISRDNTPLEQSLATIPIIEAKLGIDYKGLTLYKCPTSDKDISGFISISKLFNIKTLKLDLLVQEDGIAKLFASIISDKSLALKSINTGFTIIYQSVVFELVKIKSITSLSSTFSDWESVELLSALTNLENVNVEVNKKFEMTSSKALCSLINTCSASGIISCFDWRIDFGKTESSIGQSKITTALQILKEGDQGLRILEALSYRDLITIEELECSIHVDLNIKDILKIAEVQPIKKLRFGVYDDFEHFPDLAELEDLTIVKLINLTKLLNQLDTKESSSLQCLKIVANKLSSDELHRVSKLRSLKKLDLCDSEPEYCASLMELANWNIEELILPSSCALLDLFSAFAAKSTSRLQHLKIKGEKSLELRELKVLFKIKTLKSLQCTCLNNDVSFLRNFKHLVKLDIKLLKETNLEGLRSLAELEQLESLTLRLNKYSLLNNNDFLADIQNLKELNLLGAIDVNVNLTSVYQAFVSKNVKLTHLTTMIGCVEEVNQITQIKTLRKLHLAPININISKKLTSPGELSELESLQLTELDAYECTIVDSDYGNSMDSDEYYMMYCVLPILRCCRNLDRLLINLEAHLGDIYTHLKSIRDPTVQGPLTVIHTGLKDINEEYNIQDKFVVEFENVYMKVFSPLYALP